MKQYKFFPQDTIFSLNDEFKADPRPDKINAGIGIYLDNQGKPFVIPIISKIASKMNFKNFNYLPIQGDAIFLEESAKIILGKKNYLKQKPFISTQGVTGGTNGVYLWANLIKLTVSKPTIILSDPTWDNHNDIFNNSGFKVIKFPQLNQNKQFNFEALKNTIVKHPNAYILFQGGPTHNPTCVNPTKKQWFDLVKLFKKYNNSIFFDSAYIGLGDDFEKDCFSMRYLIKNKIKTAINFSYSKNMTLYQHRTSLLLVISENTEEKESISSCLNYLFRVNNSNPPAFGELIAKEILTNPKYKNEWLNSLSQMSKNLKERRKLFNKFTKGNFKYILEQKGFFSLLDLTPKQIDILKTKYAIYLLTNGRINFGGISLKEIPIVAKAILSVIKK